MKNTPAERTEWTAVLPNLKENVAQGDAGFAMRAHYSHLNAGRGQVLYFHWHEEVEFFLLSKGSANMQVGGQCFPVEAGDFVLIQPGQPHGAERRGTGEVEFYAVLTHPDFLSGLQNDRIQEQYILPFLMTVYQLPLILRAGTPGNAAASGLLSDICALYNKQAPGYELLIKARLFELLYVLTGSLGDLIRKTGAEPTANLQWARQTLHFIQEHSGQKITLKELADCAHMSEGYFCRSMKEAFGLSPMDFLAKYRVAQAVRLIETTDLRLNDIACETGFSNNNRFTILFKRYCSMTPNAYRQRILRGKCTKKENTP